MTAPVPPPALPSAPARRRLAAGAVAVGLLLATLAVYYRALSVPFLFDDRPAIERNASIRHLWPPAGPLSPPVTAAGAAGRPLVNLSLAFNYAIGALEPRGYHAFNVAAHALTGLLLWGLLHRALRRTAHRAAAAGLAAASALLWLVHPLQTETVACVVQRNEILVAFFYLLTLYGLDRAADSARPAVWSGVAVGACLLGMASKEVMVTAPLAALLYDRTFLAGSLAGAWRRRWRLHAALAATWLLLAALILGHAQRAGTVGFGLGVGVWPYLLTQADALATYLRLVAWPQPLVVDYGVDLAAGAGAVWVQGLAVLALLGATVIGLWRQQATAVAGAAFFLLLAPSSSFVPLTTQPIAEHRMYLPLAPVLVLVVLAGYHCLRPRRVLVLLVAAVLGAVTWCRLDDYQTEARLWRVTIAQRPENARAQASLAGVYLRNGQWPDALRHFEAALQLRPDYADVQNDYGLALAQSGRPPAALPHLEQAWRLKPDDPAIRANLGRVLVQAGQAAAALPHFAAAVRLQPDNAEVRVNLAEALQRAGQARAATEHYLAAIRLRPDLAALPYNLANVWLELDRPTDAVASLEAALRLEPAWPAARHNLALALTRAGRPAEAIPHYEAALRQLPDSAPVHHHLALALAAAGRIAEAITHDEAALRLQPDLAAARRHLGELRRR